MLRFPTRRGATWALFCLCGAAQMLFAQTPQWIWSGTNSSSESAPVYFRKSFRTPPLLWNSRLTAAADDSAEVFLNGISVAKCSGPHEPVRAEVSVRLHQGENVIAVRALNRPGPAGLLVNLNLGGETNLVTDASWLISTNEEKGWASLNFNAAHWRPAAILGPHGTEPWGNVLSRGAATPAESLTLPAGFKAELLHSARADEGSWICMAFDGGGRLLISPQGDERPLLRLAFTNGQVARVEKIAAPVRYAMGLLFSGDTLYANARGPGGAGLYRLVDTNHNDQFEADEMHLLKKFEGGSEHGYHALALGPDGRIFVLNGNGTKLPKDLSPRSAHRNYREDVLSLNSDEGEKSGTPAPAGYILRTDAEGKEWELWMGGLRNAYDFDFNADGELFTFDSDMEWDWGTPWYRPTRINHCVSGGEFGWRDDTRLWPDHYEDSLPGVVDVGIGSPTGVKFGTKSRFPQKYCRALFALDWSYGRIFAIHLSPNGASYRGEVETFLRGAPLNLTDIEFGPDGAMYFITGGRGTQSGLYRVSYVGGQNAVETAAANESASSARKLRQQLEQFHGIKESSAVAFIWPHLASKDRFIRHGARVALESQETVLWRERALAETNVTGGLTALLALARVDSRESQSSLLNALARFPLDSLPEEQTLLLLRVLELSFLRQGRSEGELAKPWVQKLDGKYPSPSWPVNRELSRLLIYLEAPRVIAKTLDLLESALTQEEQFHYVAQLRKVRAGWSTADRKRFFSWWLKPREKLQHSPGITQWFADTGRTYVDGAWVDKYLREFRADAVGTLSAEERVALSPLLAKPFEKARLVPTTGRTFVREWILADLASDLDRASSGRNFARGRQAFVDAQCLACHRFGNDGGSAGPELTAAGSKYDLRSLLESMLEPSKVINEQYRNTALLLNDGDRVTGRLVSNTSELFVIETDSLSGARQKVERRVVKEIRPSEVSPMPDGLLNVLSREEILDLLAYLQSGGRKDSPLFRNR
jgi:putative heme-binding domain-containing protein